jgi:hypothetical protein
MGTYYPKLLTPVVHVISFGVLGKHLKLVESVILRSLHSPRHRPLGMIVVFGIPKLAFKHTRRIMYCYIAHGVVIHSDLFFPELVMTQGKADAFIHLGKVERPFGPRVSLNCLKATDREVYIYWEGICTILVRDGREIIADPSPGVEQDKLHVFILGVALAVLLHQRGLLVLHASAIEVNGSVVAFIGDKGWGKSTTTAALHARGYKVVTDDLLVLKVNGTECPIVFPGFPQIKLWPDSVTALGDDPATLKRIYSQVEKRAYRVFDSFSSTPLPLKCIYVLDIGSSHKIESIQGQEVFAELVRHSFLIKLLQATKTANLHFNQCTRLASCVPIYRLKRQPSLQDLPAIAQLIEQHIVPDSNLAKV